MKKLTLALMCALGVFLMASCSKKTDDTTPKLPTIEFVKAEGFVYQNTELQVGDSILFKVAAVATDPKDLLTKLQLKVTFNNEPEDTTITLNELPSYNYTVEKDAALVAYLPGLMTIEATVTTKKGQTATVKINITITEAALEVHDLTWQRLAGMASATGLEEFGLQWKSNYKDVFASIKPVEGALFFRFNDVDFASITGETAKTVLFSQGEQITEFHEISCFAGATFDYVLGTVYNNNLYLINLTNSTVESSALGTSVTINGQWK